MDVWICIAAWFPVMYWHPDLGVFPPYTHCSQDSLQNEQKRIVALSKTISIFELILCVTCSFASSDFTGIQGTIGGSGPGVFPLCLVHLPSEQTPWWWSGPAGTLLHAALATDACCLLSALLAAALDWVLGVVDLSRNNDVNTARPVSNSW